MLTRRDSKTPSNSGRTTPKLRTACESCRQSKVKCNLIGKGTCTRCHRQGLQCQHGFANRSGKPKGSKNRATLRKMGQLQEERRRPMAKTAEGKRRDLLVVESRPAIIEQHVDQMGLNQDTAEEKPSMRTLSQSPSIATVDDRDTSNAPVSDTSVVPDELGFGFENQSWKGMLDYDSACHLTPGTDYPPMSTSMGVLSSDLVSKETSNTHLLPLPSYTSPPACNCSENQALDVNRLIRMTSDPVYSRFDECLEGIKLAVSSCGTFIQCTSCHKGSNNIAFSLFVLSTALHLLDHCVRHKPTQTESVQHDDILAYGHYEPSQEESQRIRNYLTRNQLNRCKEILSMLRKAIATYASTEQDKMAGFERHDAFGFPSSLYDETLVTQPHRFSGAAWFPSSSSSSSSSSSLPGLTGFSCGIHDSDGLCQMVARCDNVVDGLLRMVPADCFCF